MQKVLAYLPGNTDRPMCTFEILDKALHLEKTKANCKMVSRILSSQCPGWVPATSASVPRTASSAAGCTGRRIRPMEVPQHSVAAPPSPPLTRKVSRWVPKVPLAQKLFPALWHLRHRNVSPQLEALPTKKLK